MNIRRIDREIKIKQWTEVIRECRNSGRPVRSWCTEHDVDEKRYYYWLRKIREQACNTLEYSVLAEENKCEFAQIQSPVSFQQIIPTIKLYIGVFLLQNLSENPLES